MKIAIAGTDFSGKTSLATNISYAWPNFKLVKCEEDFSKDKNPLLAKFDWLTDKLLEAQDDVVFDDSLINILAQIIMENEAGNISDADTKKYILIFRQSARFYDLIFNLHLSTETPIDISDLTEEQLEKRNLLEETIQSLWWDWREERPTFFIHDDRPPFIRIYGDKEEIIGIIARDFLDSNGKPRTQADEDLQKEMSETLEEYARYKSVLAGDDSYEKILRDINFKK